MKCEFHRAMREKGSEIIALTNIERGFDNQEYG